MPDEPIQGQQSAAPASTYQGTASCHSCGASFQDVGARFCPVCGQGLAAGQPVPPLAPQQPAQSFPPGLAAAPGYPPQYAQPYPYGYGRQDRSSGSGRKVAVLAVFGLLLVVAIAFAAVVVLPGSSGNRAAAATPGTGGSYAAGLTTGAQTPAPGQTSAAGQATSTMGQSDASGLTKATPTPQRPVATPTLPPAPTLAPTLAPTPSAAETPAPPAGGVAQIGDWEGSGLGGSLTILFTVDDPATSLSYLAAGYVDDGLTWHCWISETVTLANDQFDEVVDVYAGPSGDTIEIQGTFTSATTAEGTFTMTIGGVQQTGEWTAGPA